MPCDDVTELMQLRLDDQDRLSSYTLLKRSCGRAVGEQSLLLERFQGTKADDLATLDTDEFADSLPEFSDEAELVLHLKHFFAIRGAVRTLLGIDPGGAFDPIRVARVAWEGDSLLLESELAVDIIVEEIKACGRCSGCGTKKKTAVK